MTAERDYYFVQPHPRLAWNTLEVVVREVEGKWFASCSYGFSLTGYAGGLDVEFDTRDEAGRAGLTDLEWRLQRLASCPNEKDAPTAARAAEHIAGLLRLPPSASKPPFQLELSFT